MNYFPKESRLLCNIVRLILGQNNTQNHGILQTILQQQYGIKSINQSWYDVNGGLVKSIRVWVIISHNFTWFKSLIHALGEATKGYHYDDVIMDATASQITSLTIVYSIVYSDADQIKHQSSASLAFVRGIHRRPVNSPHKWPVTRKMFPFDDVIMKISNYRYFTCVHNLLHSPCKQLSARTHVYYMFYSIVLYVLFYSKAYKYEALLLSSYFFIQGYSLLHVLQ